mmetsp:Transcript_10023/g.25967  ORF Transcript_10023/g.25967 Transcript_10023/m.25967 type:complete len:333 (+) Transcript_10023:564-1562(+)
MREQASRLEERYARKHLNVSRARFWRARAAQMCAVSSARPLPDLQEFMIAHFWTPSTLTCPLAGVTPQKRRKTAWLETWLRDASAAGQRASPVLYWPMDIHFGVDGRQRYPRLYSCTEVPRPASFDRARTAIAAAIQPSAPVLRATAAVTDGLLGGARRFVALHYRTREFDTHQQSDSAAELGKRIAHILRRCANIQRPVALYVATDADISYFGDTFRRWLPSSRAPMVSRALFWRDVAGTARRAARLNSSISYTGAAALGIRRPQEQLFMWEKLISLVEGEIASSAGLFVASRKSTMSKSIAARCACPTAFHEQPPHLNHCVQGSLRPAWN